MALNVSGLSTYTDQNSLELITKSIINARTLNYIHVQPGIKYSDAINILTNTVSLQAGGCGWSAGSSATDFTQRIITVADIKLEEAICVKTLEKYWMNKQLQPGSTQDQLPFEEVFTMDKVAQLQKTNDQLLWLGSIATGVGNLALADGFITLFAAGGSGVVDGTVGGTITTVTKSNIISTIDTQVSLLPEDVLTRDDLVMFMSYANFRLLVTALRDANNFHFTAEDGDYSMIYPSSNVKVVAVHGLTGTNNIVTTYAENMWAGTDLTDETSKFKIWYSQDFDEIRIRADFKLGTQVVAPEQVVYFTA